jgi:hypothetical protein
VEQEVPVRWPAGIGHSFRPSRSSVHQREAHRLFLPQTFPPAIEAMLGTALLFAESATLLLGDSLLPPIVLGDRLPDNPN